MVALSAVFQSYFSRETDKIDLSPLRSELDEAISLLDGDSLVIGLHVASLMAHRGLLGRDGATSRRLPDLRQSPNRDLARVAQELEHQLR